MTLLKADPPSVSASFFRSQAVSAASTIADFGTLLLMVEVLHFWYVVGTAGGAIAGAVVSFFLSRTWAFGKGKLSPVQQAFRYALVSAGCLVLNVLFVWLVTERLRFPYMASKAVVAFFVGIFFNFPLFRYFVFV